MKLIAITGQKKTGKTLLTNTIVEYLNEHNIPNKVIRFGTTVKTTVMAIFKLRNDYEYNNFVHGFITLPNGVEVSGKQVVKSIEIKFRQGNDHFFKNGIEDLIDQYRAFHQDEFDDSVLIIPDLIFKEELKWCKAHDAVVIKIKRQGSYYDPLVDQPEIDDFFADAVINNDDNENHLKLLTSDILDRILAK